MWPRRLSIRFNVDTYILDGAFIVLELQMENADGNSIIASELALLFRRHLDLNPIYLLRWKGVLSRSPDFMTLDRGPLYDIDIAPW